MEVVRSDKMKRRFCNVLRKMQNRFLSGDEIGEGGDNDDHGGMDGADESGDDDRLHDGENIEDNGRNEGADDNGSSRINAASSETLHNITCPPTRTHRCLLQTT